MKGLLARGALLDLGVPSWAFADASMRRPTECRLLLQGTSGDALFQRGAEGACASLGYQAVKAVTLADRFDCDRMVGWFRDSRGSRCIAVMDDASAVSFIELARTAGVRLLSMGRHASSTGNVCQLRHEWAVSSPLHSVAGALAAQLAKTQMSFVIRESVLREWPEQVAVISWSAPGFSSYRLEEESIHLHCSGVSLAEGCEWTSLDRSDAWMALPAEKGQCDGVMWQSSNWVESIGYAVMLSALGADSVTEACCNRAFLHRSHQQEPVLRDERFVSFVMDI